MTAPRTSVIAVRPVTDALLSMLATGTGKLVGDHAAPPEASLDVGYAIVYGVPEGSYNGPALWAPEADAILAYQVTSVSSKRDAAEWIADRVRLTLTSRVDAGGFQVAFPELVGMKVTHRAPAGSPPAATPEGPPENQIFSVPERFLFAAVSI